MPFLLQLTVIIVGLIVSICSILGAVFAMSRYWREDVARLKDDVHDLRDENKSLRDENIKLKDEIRDLKIEIADMHREIRQPLDRRMQDLTSPPRSGS